MSFTCKSLKNNFGKLVNGPLVLIPQVFHDERGFFLESWNVNQFCNLVGEEISFVQDNHSRSIRGALRGLHYQLPPFPQGKLVRCINGKIFDVAVDLRINSDTYGTWVCANLSSSNFQQFWIPEGFAHGFLTLSEVAEVFYKTTNFWNKESERSIYWNDPSLDINWPLFNSSPLLSEKDSKAPFLRNISQSMLF